MRRIMLAVVFATGAAVGGLIAWMAAIGGASAAMAEVMASRDRYRDQVREADRGLAEPEMMASIRDPHSGGTLTLEEADRLAELEGLMNAEGNRFHNTVTGQDHPLWLELEELRGRAGG